MFFMMVIKFHCFVARKKRINLPRHKNGGATGFYLTVGSKIRSITPQGGDELMQNRTLCRQKQRGDNGDLK